MRVAESVKLYTCQVARNGSRHAYHGVSCKQRPRFCKLDNNAGTLRELRTGHCERAFQEPHGAPIPGYALPRRRRGPSLAPAFVALTHVSQTFLKRPSVWLSCRSAGLESNAGAPSTSGILTDSAMLSERV